MPTTNDIWRDGSDYYIVYAASTGAISNIKSLAAYKSGDIRIMAEYYTPEKARPAAIQFRVPSNLIKQVRKLI